MNLGTTLVEAGVASVLLWVFVGGIFYSYCVYPLIISLLVRIGGRRPRPAGMSSMPTVSLVVSFYNEEEVIPRKLANFSAIDYPQDRLQFVLGSDGSTDRTNDQLRGWEHSAKVFLSFDRRRGKAPVLNDLVAAATGEVVVFSDANSIYDPHTVKRLVEQFGDPQVGGVCGELTLTSDGTDAGGEGETSYWSYESWLKQLESDCATVLGATGGVYAIRRLLFIPLPVHKSVTDDFLIPLQIVKQGYRVVYASAARAFEMTSGSMKGEFRRKVRIGAQNFAGISEFASLLHPRSGFVAFALWSHKIIRWCIPFLALGAIAATLALSLESHFYQGLLIAQAAFLLVAAAGAVADWKGIPIGFMSLPYYVTAMNAALLVGFIRFVMGKQRTTWEVIR